MPDDKNFWTALIQFLQPSKTILYDIALTEDEIYDIVNKRHEYADGTSWTDKVFGGYIYDYEFQDEKIIVTPISEKGDYDTSAHIEIIKNKFGETIFSVTYYKPLLIAIAFTAFGALISITTFWWGILVGFAIGFGMNYIIFLLGWKRVEEEIIRVFKIE